MIYTIELKEEINRGDLEYILVTSAPEVKLHVSNCIRNSFNGITKTTILLKKYYINFARIKVMGDKKVDSFKIEPYLFPEKVERYLNHLYQKLEFKIPIKGENVYVLTPKQ